MPVNKMTRDHCHLWCKNYADEVSLLLCAQTIILRQIPNMPIPDDVPAVMQVSDSQYG